MSEFVASEQEESSEFSVRHSGAELVNYICKGGKERSFQYFFMPTILADIQLFASSSSAINGAPVPDARVVLRLEGTLWCLGCIGRTYMKYVKYDEKYSKRARDNAENSVTGDSIEVC